MPAETPSGFAQNGLDRADGNPIDLGNLGRLHSVFHQGPDARKLRPRDLGRRLLLGADRCFDFLVVDQRRRRGCQHARFARRLVGRWGVRNQLLDDDLDIAQEQKLRHICAKLRLAPGKSLLDVGCGWGALGLHAVRYHRVEVTGITISEAQRTLCNQKACELALDNQWRVRLQDYRELAGERFDRVVSVGMAEHVGRAFLPAYAAALAGCLRPGGLGVVQTMGKTIRGEVTPWITKYIFPGMYLPTLGEISDHMAAAGLHITDIENLRQHYALTLENWIERFESNLDQIAKLFDERFVRMWRAYLNIACAGFKFGDLNLWQISFSRGREANAPLTRDYLYQT
jgi:cyclopropane-fatty-acyl-phospholipid synthase